MNAILFKYYKTPVGELVLASFEDKLCLCNWRHKSLLGRTERRIEKGVKASFTEGNSSVLVEAEKQLREYFSGKRAQFELPLLLIGTDFQKHVWQGLMTTSFGEILSYKDLAQKIKKEKAVRAVANANGANALSIIVPCHRIIGHNDTLVGYSGGLKVKQSLLALEGVTIKDNKVVPVAKLNISK